jgi:cell wall-associated NlpC family hydrolase
VRPRLALPCLLLTITPVVTGVGGIGTSSALAANTAPPAVRQIMATARHERGVPYVWGGTSPRGFDCSGYTRWVFARHHKRLPRTAEQQWQATRHLPAGAARAGDLVFFGRPGAVGHVAIYDGHGGMWGSPHRGAAVRHERLWPQPHMFARVR